MPAYVRPCESEARVDVEECEVPQFSVLLRKTPEPV